jgi:hypothetical protein
MSKADCNQMEIHIIKQRILKIEEFLNILRNEKNQLGEPAFIFGGRPIGIEQFMKKKEI